MRMVEWLNGRVGEWGCGSIGNNDDSHSPTLPFTHTPRLRHSRGLTLLEVIVAMALLAVGIAGSLGAISACVRSSEAAMGYSRGALFAGQVAAELERSESLEPGNMSGTFDDVEGGYAWSADIDQPDDRGLYPARITISWREGRRHFDLDVTLRPRPLPSAAGPPGSGQGPQGPQEPPGPPTPGGMP